MSPFTFEGATAYSPGLEQQLSAGVHVVKVLQAEDATTKTDKPMVKVKVGNTDGTIRDWLVVSESDFARAKLVGFFAALGMEPSDEWLTKDSHIKQSVLDTTIGKEVGIVVREEPDNRPDHQGETQLRLRGYRPAADAREHLSGGLPADTSGLPSAGAQANGGKSDDDEIPF